MTLSWRGTSLRESGTILWRFLLSSVTASVCLVPLALAPAPPPARRCHYRQRDAFLSPLWRILVDHLETFVATYDSRFVDTYGPLKPYADIVPFGELRPAP